MMMIYSVMSIMNQTFLFEEKMIRIQYPKVLYDVSPRDFKILDDDHVYKMSSEINSSTSSSSYHHIYWSTVAESGLITQQVSL